MERPQIQKQFWGVLRNSGFIKTNFNLNKLGVFRFAIIFSIVLGSFFVFASRADAAAITSAKSGNWSDTSTWTGGVVPGDGDFVEIRHAVMINQNVGTLGGGGIKRITINAAAASLTVDNSVARTIIFASTGTDPVGTGTNLSPGTDATMFGFFCSKGSMNLTGTDANPVTITSADDSSPIYFHHDWGDLGTYNGFSLTLSYCVIRHLGTNVAGFYGINYDFRGGSVSVSHCDISDFYYAFYSVSGPMVFSFTNNTFSGARGKYTIYANAQIATNSVITDNTETSPTVSGILFYTNYRTASLNFQRNAVTGNTSYKRGLILVGSSGTATGGNVISGNLAKNYYNASNTDFKNISINLYTGDTTSVISNNVSEGGHQEISLAALTSSAAALVQYNYLAEYSDAANAQGIIMNYDGTSLIKNNILNLLTQNNNINFMAYRTSSGPILDNNTLIAAGSKTANRGMLFGESGFPVSGAKVRNNIISGSFNTGLTGENSLNTFTVDAMWSSGVHHNNVYGATNSYSPLATSGTGFGDGTREHPNAVYGDLSVDPQFVNSSVSFTDWDLINGGPGTYDNIFTQLGYRSGIAGTYNSAYSIESLRQYMFAGFAPKNTALKGAASDGGDIGAVPVVDTTAPTVTAFGIPPTSTSLTVPITTPFTATDAFGVTGYLVNESATPPYGWRCWMVRQCAHTIYLFYPRQ